MSCESCKKKNDFQEEVKNSTSFVGKGVVVFVIVWTMLAIYGLVNLIQKII
jgi:hypothetical protein